MEARNDHSNCSYLASLYIRTSYSEDEIIRRPSRIVEPLCFSRFSFRRSIPHRIESEPRTRSDRLLASYDPCPIEMPSAPFGSFPVGRGPRVPCGEPATEVVCSRLCPRRATPNRDLVSHTPPNPKIHPRVRDSCPGLSRHDLPAHRFSPYDFKRHRLSGIINMYGVPGMVDCGRRKSQKQSQAPSQK